MHPAYQSSSLSPPSTASQATNKQLKADLAALAKENRQIKKLSTARKRHADELQRKQRRSLKVFNALTSVAAMFRDFFIDRSGDTELENLDEKYWDRRGNQRLRDWVRAKWPRKISKILGNQLFETTFSFRTAIEPISDSSDESLIRRRRRRRTRTKSHAVHLTDMPPSDSEEELSNDGYVCYDARQEPTWWLERKAREKQ